MAYDKDNIKDELKKKVEGAGAAITFPDLGTHESAQVTTEQVTAEISKARTHKHSVIYERDRLCRLYDAFNPNPFKLQYGRGDRRETVARSKSPFLYSWFSADPSLKQQAKTPLRKVVCAGSRVEMQSVSPQKKAASRPEVQGAPAIQRDRRAFSKPFSTHTLDPSPKKPTLLSATAAANVSHRKKPRHTGASRLPEVAYSISNIETRSLRVKTIPWSGKIAHRGPHDIKVKITLGRAKPERVDTSEIKVRRDVRTDIHEAQDPVTPKQKSKRVHSQPPQPPTSVSKELSCNSDPALSPLSPSLFQVSPASLLPMSSPPPAHTAKGSENLPVSRALTFSPLPSARSTPPKPAVLRPSEPSGPPEFSEKMKMPSRGGDSNVDKKGKNEREILDSLKAEITRLQEEIIALCKFPSEEVKPLDFHFNSGVLNQGLLKTEETIHTRLSSLNSSLELITQEINALSLSPIKITSIRKEAESEAELEGLRLKERDYEIAQKAIGELMKPKNEVFKKIRNLEAELEKNAVRLRDKELKIQNERLENAKLRVAIGQNSKEKVGLILEASKLKAETTELRRKLSEVQRGIHSPVKSATPKKFF